MPVQARTLPLINKHTPGRPWIVHRQRQRDDLINFATASGIYAPTASGSGANPRQWVLGDIVHSQPAILYDRPNNRNVIFVGANDGFLHCFIDSDQGTSDSLADDTVTEAWAFIPWDLLPNLKYLPSDNSSKCH